MSYTPQAPDAFFPPFLPGDTTAFDTLWANHQEVLEAYEQTIAVCGVAEETVDAVALTWRFRQRGGAGLGKLRVIIEVDQTGGGTFTYTLQNESATVTDSDTTGSAGPHTVTLTVVPDAADDDYELIVERTSGGGRVNVLSWVAFSMEPLQPRLIPGWRDAPATNPWLTTDQAIAEEHIERLTNGPRALAKDRPHCLFYHGWPEDGDTPKTDDPSYQFWGWTGSTARAGRWQQVGHGVIEVTGLVPRTVVIDAWVIASGTAAASLSIGAIAVPIPASGQWERASVTLTPGIHELIATVQVNANNDFAYFHALHVWRL